MITKLIHRRITTGHSTRVTPTSENSSVNNYTKDGGTQCLLVNNKLQRVPPTHTTNETKQRVFLVSWIWIFFVINGTFLVNFYFYNMYRVRSTCRFFNITNTTCCVNKKNSQIYTTVRECVALHLFGFLVPRHWGALNFDDQTNLT